jgi:hypothetical protein
MADMEMIKFEAAVEKLCADWEVDIAKAFKREQDAIDQRTKQLTQQIVALPFPTDADADELSKVPNRINEILKDEATDIWNRVALDLPANIDEKTSKLSISGAMIYGDFFNIRL